MEIEAKYRVVPEQLDRVADLGTLGAYTLQLAPVPERQVNQYFDTADGRLAAARHGLRVRRIDEHAQITLKGPAEGADGLSRRDEYEFPGDNPDPAGWPPGPARDLALQLTGGAPLQPTVAVHTERRVVQVLRDGTPVAELALDKGHFHGGGRTEPFSELEIELKPAGYEADLAQIAAALARHISLAPEHRSKQQRALALAAPSTPSRPDDSS